MGKLGSLPEKVLWPPVLLIFYLSITMYSILMVMIAILVMSRTLLMIVPCKYKKKIISILYYMTAVKGDRGFHRIREYNNGLDDTDLR